MGFLTNLVGKRATPMIGVDISSSCVKVIELSEKNGNYRIEAYASEPLPPAAVNERQIVDLESVGQALAKAVKRSGTKTKEACVAVAGSSVITKTIQLAADLREAEIEEQIKLEADQYVPYPIDEVNLDFRVIGPTANAPETVDVLLAACRTDTINQRVAALDMARLEPKIVDIEGYALENGCTLLLHQMPNRGEQSTVAIADIGATNTAFMVMHDRRTIYRREQQFGGRQLTEDIMRHYGMSHEEAEEAKRLGGLPEDFDSEVLPYFIDDLAQQIDRSLQLFFANSPKFSEIDQILLAGGSAAIPQLADQISSKLGLDAAVATPLAGFDFARKAKKRQLEQEQSALLVALGLGMRAFPE